MNILHNISQAFGQNTNFSKLHAIFHKYASSSFKQQTCTTPNMPHLGDQGYLCIPFAHSQKQTHICKPLVQKLQLEFDSWKRLLLFKASTLTTIKSIIQAIHLHLMSCLRIPQTICLCIEKWIRKFYWGGCQVNRKVHWVGWDTLCIRKMDGGHGLRKIFIFNKALFAKQWWTLIINPNSLLARLFKAFYYPNSFFLEANIGGKPFPYWRGPVWGRDLLQLGLGWRIEDGSQVSMRKDNWVPGSTCFKPYHLNKSNAHLRKVVDWLTTLRIFGIILYSLNTSTLLMLIGYPKFLSAKDKIVWLSAKDGEFSESTSLGVI